VYYDYDRMANINMAGAAPAHSKYKIRYIIKYNMVEIRNRLLDLAGE
jgi:hypothetical protein